MTAYLQGLPVWVGLCRWQERALSQNGGYRPSKPKTEKPVAPKVGEVVEFRPRPPLDLKTHNRYWTFDRPDEEVFYYMIDRIANGEALTKLCMNPDFPSYSVFVKWVYDNPEWFELYTRARQLQADYYADDTVRIADDTADVARARNMMDARRWHAAKIAPRKYGDKLMQELNANVTTTTKLDLRNMSAEVRTELRRAILNQQRGIKTIEGNSEIDE